MAAAGQIPSPTTRIHVGGPLPTPNTTYLPPVPTPSVGPMPNCTKIDLNYDIALAVICGLCFVFGILYCFFGYRFFKATMFMTGFIFGALVTYLICLEENLLPLEGKIGVSITAGVLCGLITMLVQYVGLFMTGFHLGLLLSIAALIVLEQFHHPTTKWIPIGVIFGAGLVFALLILYFQKSLTIVGSSIFGAALMTVALDYYVEMFIMVHYIWDRVKADDLTPVCWFSWLILGLWPTALLIGIIIQAKVTGKGFDHTQAVHVRRRRRKVNLQRERERDRERDRHQSHHRHGNHGHMNSASPSPPSWSGTIHSKYRHLYQIRRVNGDVIAQSYIQNIQHKLSPALQALTSVSTEDEAVNSGPENITRMPGRPEHVGRIPS